MPSSIRATLAESVEFKLIRVGDRLLYLAVGGNKVISSELANPQRGEHEGRDDVLRVYNLPSAEPIGTARFRLSTAGDLAPTGAALDGEVEDYAVSIIPPVAGAGLFREQIDITTGALGAREVFAADLDGDGHMDVLSASFDDDTFAWFKNDGNANFIAMPAIDAAADGARSVFAADLDGDGEASKGAAARPSGTYSRNKASNRGRIVRPTPGTTSSSGTQRHFGPWIFSP